MPLAAARVVLTHSTYVPGLISFLQSLDCSFASTITPGRISRTKGNATALSVAITVPVPGGYKALAKRGSLCQEVFFTSAAGSAELLQAALDARLAQLR